MQLYVKQTYCYYIYILKFYVRNVLSKYVFFIIYIICFEMLLKLIILQSYLVISYYYTLLSGNKEFVIQLNVSFHLFKIMLFSIDVFILFIVRTKVVYENVAPP